MAAAVVAGSMIPGDVRSQPTPLDQTGGSGSAPASVDDTTDDEGGGTGSGKLPVAPKDPKARDAWLGDKLTAAITSRPKLGKTKLTFAVKDVTLGKPLFARESEAAMNLASNAKVLTSVAALGTLGGGFRWRTAVFGTKLDDVAGTVEDLYVRGRGDPLLSVADLRQLAADVAARGVRSVEGKLVIDTSYFDNVVEPPHFDEQKLERAGFRAPIAAFGVARSAVTVIVTADPGGTGANVRLEPDSGDYVKVTKKEVTTVTDQRSRVRIDVKPKAGAMEIEVSGQIRAADGMWDLRKRVDDPAKFAAEIFKRALAERGVKVKKIVYNGAVPATGAKVLAVHESPTLANVLREMNKLSDNNVAEAVLKTLGAETRKTPGPATWADAIAAVNAYLVSIGLPAGGFRYENGSGLFGSTAVSAAQLVAVLAAAHDDYKIGPDLVASLPIGGQDGTLARRWHGHPAQGRVRAKTGTLSTVSTLAGYIALDANHVIAFAILANDIAPGARPLVREAMDEMVDVLAAYLAK